MTYLSGDIYEGEWQNDKQHGQGKITSANGSVMRRWQNGKSYTGTMVHPNGGKYVGHFQNGKPHGTGTMAYPNGVKYVGHLKNGKDMAPEQWRIQMVANMSVIFRMVSHMAKAACMKMRCI